MSDTINAEADAIRFLGDMTKLEVGPNDIMVLQLDRIISDVQFHHLMERMVGIFGPGKVVILDHGMKLGAVSVASSAPVLKDRERRYG